MGKVIFILGGARSGKSQFAIKIAKDMGKKVAFIATCQPLDKEMEKRIAIHKKARPKHWKTFEEPGMASLLLNKICNKFDFIIIDCLTLLVSNLLLNNFSKRSIEDEIKKILSTLAKAQCSCVIVSNEIGLGIVPENKLARDFRDIAGYINQIAANKANEVFFMVSGLSWRLK